MDHRRTPGRKPYVPAGWFIVLTILLCLAGAGGLGWLVVDGEGDDAAPAATATTPPPTTTTPEPTTTTEPTKKPRRKPKPTPARTTEPPVQRNAPVSVLNNTRVPRLAATYSGRVQAAGWTVAGVGNWRGSIAGNTVYFPAGLEPQARLLATDLGIARVLPGFAPMRMDRLTVILAGPQQ